MMAKGSRTRMVATLCLWTGIGFLGAGVLKTALPRHQAKQASGAEEQAAVQEATPLTPGSKVPKSKAQRATDTPSTEAQQRQEEHASDEAAVSPPAAAETGARVEAAEAENLTVSKAKIPDTTGETLVSRTPVAPTQEPALSDADFDSMYSAELERLGKIVEPLVK